MIPTLIVISIVAFILIQLPPGDYLTSYAAQLASQGEGVDNEQLTALKQQYGLDKPVYVQYWKWMSRILFHGDFGQSLEWHQPVSSLIWQRIAATILLTFSSLIFTWVLAIPIGVYSARHQYSKGDYLFTALGFLGLSVPSFMIALVLMWVAFRYFGQDVGGLYSPQYQNAPWSFAKVINLLEHYWIPLAIIGLAGTAALIRTLRANLLDELHKPYVTAARARGLSESKLVWEYPVRVALNPFVSSLGFEFANLISGATIIGIVLSLPLIGPLFLRSLQSQDMYLAGAIILILSTLTVIGVLISDILLAWLDPRIRYT
jgi:peptide/nickel transport system permease protein